jgi:predicted nucleic acid-binding protein
MIVVSDTSPITNLLRIGRIDLLQPLFGTVVIPEAVHEEIAYIEEQRVAISKIDWITVVPVTNADLLGRLLVTLDRGEAEALTLAVELDADAVLIDESKGREEARKLNLPLTGILGVLIGAKEEGLIPLVEPEIRRLVDNSGFWLSEELIDSVLRTIGER